MTEQLADCSADEAKIIKETVVNLKISPKGVREAIQEQV